MKNDEWLLCPIYLTVKEVGEKRGISARIVTYHCVAGRIDGAIKKGNLWLVPTKAEKSKDLRYKNKNFL